MPRPRARARDRWWYAAAGVAVLLTLGQIFWWHNHDAHRSLFSLGMTVLWTVSLSVVPAGSLRRMRREGHRPRRRRTG